MLLRCGQLNKNICQERRILPFNQPITFPVVGRIASSNGHIFSFQIHSSAHHPRQHIRSKTEHVVKRNK